MAGVLPYHAPGFWDLEFTIFGDNFGIYPIDFPQAFDKIIAVVWIYDQAFVMAVSLCERILFV
jgi:hypothetical protein